MKRKNILAAAVMLVLAIAAICFAGYGLNYRFFTTVDEYGQKASTVTSVSVYEAGTSTLATLYTDDMKAAAISNPITGGDLRDNGAQFWTAASSYDALVTDGIRTVIKAGMNGTDTRLTLTEEIDLPTVVTPASGTVTLYPDDAGTDRIYTNSGVTGDCTYTLPPAAVGLVFTFSDISATAADDLLIQAPTGDVINGGTAAKIYECVTDAVKQTTTIVAIDGTYWIVIREVGTWANNDS